MLSRQIPVTVGEVVTASVWAHRVSGATGTLYLEFRDAAGNRLGTPPSASVAAGGWRPVSVTGTAPAGAVGLTIRLYSMQASTGTTLWDSVSLRSSADASYDPTLNAGATVLFVGDQRVEHYTGVQRVMRPGTDAGTGGSVFSGIGGWDANPRLSGTVLPVGAGYAMWYTTSHGTGYATSDNGFTWDRGGRTSPVHPGGTGGVVPNPAWAAGNGLPKYFMLRPGMDSDPNRRYYYAIQSLDGVTWTALPGATRIPGWDVVNVTYDPVQRRFVAMTKQYPVAAGPVGPRTVWVSTSADFKTWPPPQPAFAADFVDDQLIPAGTGKRGMTPWTEIYGMPAIRYGDQYLGTPWVFDLAYSPNRASGGDPGPDTGRSHIGLAASRDLVNWSRPNRADLITPGPAGPELEEAWDWGFAMTGTTLLNVLVGDVWQTRLYYGAFAGEHSCKDETIKFGNCTVVQGNSKIGLVSWPMDRFQSFRAAAGGGSVTTRPLTPTGRTLRVNYDPGASGALRVEVLNAAGEPIEGYRASDATPVTTNAVGPGQTVSWKGVTTLPTGTVRLRLTMTDGDLYAFTIS